VPPAGKDPEAVLGVLGDLGEKGQRVGRLGLFSAHTNALMHTSLMRATALPASVSAGNPRRHANYVRVCEQHAAVFLLRLLWTRVR